MKFNQNYFQNLLLALFIFLGFGSGALAQQKAGTLSGVVTDYNSGKTLGGVLVQIEGTQLSGRTDEDGRFVIRSVPAGKYTLVTLKSGYYSCVSDPVEIKPSARTDVTLRMLTGDPDKCLYFSLGGITVTADRDLIPSEHETIHKISSGEIEHMQATNLGDIMDLIPGVDRKNQPGLQNKTVIGLRGNSDVGGKDTPDLFGTRVIVDDIPLSNNANMNAGDGVGYGSNVQTNANTGIDLRELPADNIQEVDVIAGVPSVEYGDVTGGIIRVKTRDSAEPLRVKFKNNPDTREANIGGGFKIGEHTVANLNLNDAYSLRDIRLDGDEVHRITAQGRFSHSLKDKRLVLTEKIAFTRFFEDYSVKDDPFATKAYNHDYKLILGHTAEYQFSKKSSVYYRGYLNYTHRNSYKRRYNVIDPTYVTDLMTNGTREGVLLTEPYNYEVKTTGKEYNAGAKINYKYRLIWKKMVHNFMLGSEYQYDGNKGPGKQFDPLRPISLKSSARPRSFDDVPGFKQLSIYFEDRVTGKLVFPATLTLGLRGEMYNPEGLGGKDLIKSQNGTFWNPRVGLKVRAHRNFQFRASYGVASKAPSLLQIYPDPVYVDVLERGFNGADTVNLLTTYVYPIQNKNLQGYRQKKAEIGIDLKYGKAGLSLVGFWQKTTGSPQSVQLPYIWQEYFWPSWPNPDGKVLKHQENYYLSEYEYITNLGWADNRGLELIFKTLRIRPLNMRFNISGSYSYKRYGYSSSLSVSNPRTVTEIANGDTIVHDLFPIYPPYGSWRKKLLMTYKLDYISRPLGIWLTLTVYHRAMDKYKSADYPADYRVASGYYEGGKYYELTPERAREMGLISEFDNTSTSVIKNPATYYFNFTISKNITDNMEVSLFLNNMFNWRNYYTNHLGNIQAANPEIFYGIEFSMKVNPIARQLTRRLGGSREVN
ncbi:MAG: TonB-dependent receptor [Calditrichia bacterium]